MKIDLVLTLLQVAVFVVALFILIWCAFDMCQMRCERKKLLRGSVEARINHLQHEVDGIVRVTDGMIKQFQKSYKGMIDLAHEVELLKEDIHRLTEEQLQREAAEAKE